MTVMAEETLLTDATVGTVGTLMQVVPANKSKILTSVKKKINI